MIRYICHYFQPYELVPEAVYKLLGDESIYLIDYRVRITADQLRQRFGSATANNYLWGGHYQERGFRLRHTQTGASDSKHKDGQALDIKFANYTAAEVRKGIVKNRYLFPFITRLEKDVNWVHFDIKVTGKDKIVLFNG